MQIMRHVILQLPTSKRPLRPLRAHARPTHFSLVEENVCIQGGGGSRGLAGNLCTVESRCKAENPITLVNLPCPAFSIHAQPSYGLYADTNQQLSINTPLSI
ncbi:hypothetical protein RSOL_405860 [Rhizoctonia solani AG-3 Rhs1AP]|uniref:Uncharacterized protein n=1 Tax=Rhizoctonia solani AG-3 Rhs1AP TaxID=1086054 RepID=X8JDP0_9AGAM|nr:hypothetical protein RSOL_405860 [Rhizoctonia solani AG-3 Rhs1AP]